MEQLDIPEPMRDYVAASWTRGDPSLYGRFDFAYDGRGPAKLYEYNADTPTSIYETAFFQWQWLEENVALGRLPAGADQFNRLHEALVQLGAVTLDGAEVDVRRHLCVLPLAFDYGQNQLLAAWASGGSAIGFDYLLPRDVVRAVRRRAESEATLAHA